MAGDSQRLLIINADDLGLAPGITRGILELAQRGSITSASLIANMPASAAALDAARSVGLDVGLHLNICVGRPLSPPDQVSSLLRRDGQFAALSELLWRRTRGWLVLNEVEREWSTQVEWCLASGASVSHIDTHCHIHGWLGMAPLLSRVAQRYGIPAMRCAVAGFVVPAPFPFIVQRHPQRPLGTLFQPDCFAVLTTMGYIHSVRRLRQLLRILPPGVCELVCHPGYADDELRRLDSLTNQREHEMNVLSRPWLRATAGDAGLSLVSWSDVVKRI